MRGFYHLAVRSMASILLMLAVAACVSPLTPEERAAAGTEFPIRVYMPYGRPQTKSPADQRLVDGTSRETTIYNLQIWAFEHCVAGDQAADGQGALAYCMIDDVNLGSGWRNKEQVPSGRYAHWDSDNILRVMMLLPKTVASMPAERMKFDFYILANAGSIGVDDFSTVTRGDLRELVFGRSGQDDWFGPTALTSEPAQGLGLPITGFYNQDAEGDPNGVDLSFLHQNLDEDEPAIDTLKLPVIQVTRAVSKIRFLFSRQTGMNEVSIDSIRIADYASSNPAPNGLIPRSTFVFPRETGDFAVPEGVNYDSVVLAAASDEDPLLAAGDIAVSDNPEALRKTDNQTSQEYDDFVQLQLHPIFPGVESTMTQRLIYLRESDKPLKGRIYYSIEGKSYVLPFSMEGLVSTNFHRNHSWTVYAYFSERAIHFKASCEPWITGGHFALTGDLPPGIE